MATAEKSVSSAQIEQAIHFVRGQKVMLDSDLAKLYGVTTKRLNEQVRRNRSRFPADFMFQLASEEAANLRSQIATSRPEHGGRRYRPYVFTEQGVAMLSSVLQSPKAVRVNIQIMRAFVRLRQVLAGNAELALRLAELERRVGDHDQQFIAVIRAIRELMSPPPAPKKRSIGFHAADEPQTPTPPTGKRKGR